MHNFFGAIGALVMALGVLAGAFGAHGLQKLTTDLSILEPYKTAVQYMLWHGLALLVLWSAQDRFTHKQFMWIGICFVDGVVLFSGSLFVIVAGKIFSFSIPWLVMLTPIGGLHFVAGWLLLGWGLIGKQRN
jgi:uncharacterized membrane protein YgdD (TMEM256/DUF423 family)